MENINFATLEYKEYILNGDEKNVLRIATTDYGIIERWHKAKEEAIAIYESIEDKKTPDIHIFAEMDSEVRRIINAVFDDGDVCTRAFGNHNCLSIAANGKPMVVNFIKVFEPIIVKEFGNSLKSVQENTAKYTEIIESEPTALPDMSSFTDEQKAAILAQLTK